MGVLPRRRGVASVVGTVFFVLVFMLALGALAYSSSLQQQTAAVQELAVQAASERGSESLAFAVTASGMLVTNEGPTTALVNHVVLRFPNGTAYAFAEPDSIPSGGVVYVQSLIPSGICSPGGATCASKYAQIVAGNPTGGSVGILTALGNTFWYTHQDSQIGWSSLTGFPLPCPPGEAVKGINTTLTCTSVGGVTSWAKVSASTSGTSKYSSTGISVLLPANGTYAFYAITAMEPATGFEKYNFEIHSLPSGASVVIACAPLSAATGGGNIPTNCVYSAATPIAINNALAFGVAPPVYETPGLFGVVTSGPSGSTLQIDFACTFGCGSVSLKAGSFMVVQALG